MAVAARLLIIDDEPDASEFMKLLVEPRGYLVRTALNAAEARQVLETWQPEIILMDLMLPDADGLELLREFKEASPESQVIMVTGYGSVPKAVTSFVLTDVSIAFSCVPPNRVSTLAAKSARSLSDNFLKFIIYLHSMLFVL